MRRSLGGMLDAVRHDSAPPLAYLLDRLVSPISTSPAALRLVPALAGTAAIPIGGALARRCGGPRAGLWGAGVCALAPALVASARDARMYALATTAVMATVLLLWRALERPSPARWALYAAAVAAAAYTQYFALLAIAAQLTAAVLVLRPPRVRMLTAAAAAAAGTASLAPWLLTARAQLTHGSAPFWVGPVSPRTLGGVILQFLSGPPVDPGVPGRLALQCLQALAAGAGGMAACALLRRHRRLSPEQGRATGFVAACGLGAPLLLVLVSLWHPLVEARYVSVLWGPLLPLLGVGLALLRCRPLGAVALLLLGAASAGLALGPLHPDTPAAVADLRGRVGPHDLVSADPATYLLVLYYGDGPVAARAHIVARDVPWYWGTAAYPPGAVLPSPPGDVERDGGAIFHVLEAPTDSETAPPPGYALTGRICHTGICVESYRPVTRPPAPPPAAS